MSDFYTGLRDDDALPLIKSEGQRADYYSVSEPVGSEDFMTFTQEETKIPIWLLDLPVRSSREEGGREFEAETTARAKAKFLTSATELATADVTPKPGDRVELIKTGQSFRVLAVNPVAPSGIAVIYKMLVGD